MQIYNTLTQKKELFTPLQPGKVGFYGCGVTVYDRCHIGHARTFIALDMIVRYFKWRGYEVNYVRNITDIDDKIIKRANENNESFDVLTDRNIALMHDDLKALNIEPPTLEPRATAYMDEIISLIDRLLKKQMAYQLPNGDVYFNVRNYKGYGKLSHRNIENLETGARVEPNSAKKDSLDFALWKSVKPNEPSWDAPWGKGRPGWHIECSAMSTSILGQPFDIHAGGMDLKFPHHENEIAQSESAHDKTFANLWMHIGLLNINDEKMSKSLGNFLTIDSVLKKYPVDVIRYFMLSGHYRSPLNYSEKNLGQAQKALTTLYRALDDTPNIDAIDTHYVSLFQEKMDDDFNTPKALSVLFSIAHDINRIKKSDKEKAAILKKTLKHLGSVLALLQENPDEFLKGQGDDVDPVYIDQLIEKRAIARKEKDWATADQIRDELDALDVVLEDANGQTQWRKK